MSIQRKRQKWSRSIKHQSTIEQAKNGIDFVSSLFSKELVLKVFSFLSCTDLVQCAAVSMNWSRMANDEMLWKPLFMNRFRNPGLKQSKHTKRPASSAIEYGGSWKMKYRIYHNWLQGNCEISNILNVPNRTVMNSDNSRHHLQFSHDTLFIAQSQSSIVDVWKYNGTIKPTDLICQLQAVDLASDTFNNASITCLKLLEKSTTAAGYLIAGYSNGGFTIWKITDSITEIASYFPTNRSTSKVISIEFDYPMMLLFTKDMQLSVFHIKATTSQLQLLHHLQSPMDWTPVAIDIHRFKSKKKKPLWKIVVCFGLFATTTGTSNTSVGIQEIVLSSQSVLSSKQGFVLDEEPLISSGLSCNTPRHSLSERITAMSYASPYLITAHDNNTLKQYTVATTCSGRLDIQFQQTLYGHTFKVDAIAMNQHKLVSGDRSGIRVWDLQAPGECQVALHSFRDQSNMKELPDASIETLGFDEDKIVAIIRVNDGNSDNTSIVRTWSFT